MTLLLNIISIIATFIVIEGIFYFALDNTVGRINVVKRFKYKDLIFLSIGVLFMILFFDFHLPH